MRQMTAYKDMTLDQRRAEYAALQTAFADLKAQGLKLDMTRGKPCKDQLDMVSDIFDMLKEPEDYIVDGIDIRNYGALSGLPEAKRLFANLLDCKPKQVFVGGNASLQLMYGVIDFYKAAKKRGIKPIIGCEIYVAKRSRFDKIHGIDNENRHLVLLCKNETGYRNLVAIVSKAWTEGFYSKPRADMELLREHSEGLIALSACLAGEIPRALSVGDYDEAKAAALRYREIFGEDNFYLELQDHGLREQAHINPQIIRLSKDTGIPLVVTNDCHYIEKEDTKMHHILVCIQTNRTVEDEDTLEFGSDEFYFKSEDEMRALFPDCPEAADNTQKIADRCNCLLYTSPSPRD